MNAPPRILSVLLTVGLVACGDVHRSGGSTSEVPTIIPAPIGFTLRGANDPSHPDPWLGTRPTVAVDASGQVYTKTRANRSVAVWSSSGEFVREVGSPGEGPGEFTRGVASFRVIEGDSVVVLDGGGRWTVFDSAGRFARTFRAPTSREMVAHPTPDGRIVFTGPFPGADGAAALHFTDRRGRYLESRGHITDSVVARAPGPRPSALAGGHLWVAPPQGVARGLVLERRSLDGSLDDVLRIEVPWLPLDGYPEPYLRGVLPDFKALSFEAERGLLWVVVAARDPWVEGRSEQELRAAEESDLGDLWLLAIDPGRREIVGSLRFDALPGGMPPIYPVQNRPGWFVGSEVDALGLEMVSLFRMILR